MPNVIPVHYEILEYPANILQNIERAARTCYKSENKITNDSAVALVKKLIDSGHHAMVEFGGWIVVKFYSNRGFTHELVRHRPPSFAQESTRYCNYSKAKFGAEITVCDPEAVLRMKVKDLDKQAAFKAHLIETWAICESRYMELVGMGCPAELAREGLPIGLKAEIVIGANVREWRHIMKLRTKKSAHPRMREIMRPLLADFRYRTPIVFDDVGTLTDEAA
jgi:thymidylate synthase (FAD)